MSRGIRSAVRARRLGATGALVALFGGAVLLGAPEARAQINYTGHAEAYGLRVTATNDAFPLGFVFEGDAPISTADLSSLGDSQALAAGPYPGTMAASTPGAVGGVVGLPIPNYPVVAQATAGDNPVQQNLPGLALRADAGATRASGVAVFGSAAQGAETQAVVESTELGSDGVRAEGRSRLEALALLDFLHFQRVLASAVTTLDPSGERTTSADLRIDGITAPGLSFAVPPQTPSKAPLPNPVPGLPQPPSLEFPPAPIPGGGATYGVPELGFRNGEFVVTYAAGGVEQRMPVPFQAVADAFRAIGVTVTYQEPQEIPNGILAPTLTFVTEFPAPPSPNPFGVEGPTPVTLELGRASASIAGGAVPGLGIGGVGSNTADGGTASGSVPGVPGPADPLTDSVAGTIPGIIPGAADATAPGAVPGTPTAGAEAPRSVTLTSDTIPGAGPGSPFTDLYLVFVVVAAAVLVAGPLVTFVGARTQWGS